jgi:hypothetical protein
MGSSFIAYAILLLIVMLFGQDWLRKHNFSQEYLDSWALLVWGAYHLAPCHGPTRGLERTGIVNTFTEHGFLGALVKNSSLTRS